MVERIYRVDLSLIKSSNPLLFLIEFKTCGIYWTFKCHMLHLNKKEKELRDSNVNIAFLIIFCHTVCFIGKPCVMVVLLWLIFLILPNTEKHEKLPLLNIKRMSFFLDWNCFSLKIFGKLTLSYEVSFKDFRQRCY